MPDRLSDKIREYLETAQGKVVHLRDMRAFLKIEPGSKDDQNLRTQMATTMVAQKVVSPSGLNDGHYKVIKQVKPVTVFGKDRHKPIDLFFPKDFDTGMEMSFAEDIILREGDLILISGRSNYGKTQMCLAFCGENIDTRPVLMGNEYTSLDDEPSPRFLNRLDNMDWVEWVNGTGEDKFTLLPVRDDYAEHIVRDRINIIDWINIGTGEHYMIGPIAESIKKAVGNGIAIIAIQKAEGATSGRGGQFTKDFADIEILLDRYSDDEVLLTIGKVKESNRRVTGRTFAYHISQGVKIINFREVVKCKACFGKGWKLGKPCDECFTTGYLDK